MNSTSNVTCKISELNTQLTDLISVLPIVSELADWVDTYISDAKIEIYDPSTDTIIKNLKMQRIEYSEIAKSELLKILTKYAQNEVSDINWSRAKETTLGGFTAQYQDRILRSTDNFSIPVDTTLLTPHK